MPKIGEMTAKERHREERGRGFQVFGEPGHRMIAKYLAGITRSLSKGWLEIPNNETTRFGKTKHGVLLLYPVRETPLGPISIGFEIFFPPNSLPFDLNFTVRRRAEQDMVVV